MAKKSTTLTREFVEEEIKGLKLLGQSFLPNKRKKALFFKLVVSPNGNVKTSFVVLESSVGSKKQVIDPIKLRTYSSIDFALTTYNDIL